MKTSHILISICKILFPFMFLFGLYVILNGHISPGGGFQGGAILATSILITYFIGYQKIEDLNLLIKIEKITFIIIILIASISLITKGQIFTNFFPVDSIADKKKIFLILLNFFIGVKVASGLITLFSTFIEEGKE